jgi:diguanylate cyclase (GGDEF)-like protein
MSSLVRDRSSRLWIDTTGIADRSSPPARERDGRIDGGTATMTDDPVRRPMEPFGLRRVFDVASTRRFRASERRRILDASRLGLRLVMAAAAFNCLWLVPYRPDAAGLILSLNLFVVIVAAIGSIAITSLVRRRPEAVVLVVLVVVDLATITMGAQHDGLRPVALGYLLLLPPIVALAMPWATPIHATWLGMHAAIVLYIVTFGAGTVLLEGGRIGGVGLLLVSATVSQYGNIESLRARVMGFVQIEHIRALSRESRRTHERLERLNRLLDQTARTDDLTGLGNRMSLKLDLASIRSRIDRRDERYGLLLLDLDHFKTINDSVGHVAGDAVLRSVAAAIVGATRGEDGAYRYGGEEFAVVMRVTGPREARAAAERIRRAVEDLRLPHPGNLPHRRVTLSIGVATVGPEDLDDDDDAWFARADGALYLAKAAGRNQSLAEIPDEPRSLKFASA